jgi:Fe-S cluster assembly scaffold protein SufB
MMGLDVCLMSAALSKPKYRKLINTYFNKIAPEKDEYDSLEYLLCKERGAFINIPKNVVAEKPIEIIHFSSGNENALWLQPRNLIIVERECTGPNNRKASKPQRASSSYELRDRNLYSQERFYRLLQTTK